MGGYQWLWKDKKPSPQKMDFAVSNEDEVFMKNQIKMTLTIDLTSPVTQDVAALLRNSKVDFCLPPHSTITSVLVNQVEFMGRGGV